jgi:CotH kinase protein/Lamin Tail Domain
MYYTSPRTLRYAVRKDAAILFIVPTRAPQERGRKKRDDIVVFCFHLIRRQRVVGHIDVPLSCQCRANMMMMTFISRPPPCRYVPSHVRAEPFLVLLLLELVVVFFIVVVLFHTGGCSADLIFSEIADQGTSSSAYCAKGEDWLELHNTYTTSFYLSGLILHDDHGVNDTDHAYTFPPGQRIAPGEYLVLCMEGTNDPLTSPQFKIGGSDTITLFNPFTQQIVASVGPLPDGPERAFDVTYAWNNNLPIMSQSSSYIYTKTPTPGSANILTPIIMNDENNETTTAQLKQRLKLQNALGTQFFGMDDIGLPVPDRLDDVLDLHLSMEQADYEYLMQNASFQLYSPFTSARVTRNNSNTDVQEDLLVLNSPGRIRTKGQSSLNIAYCLRQKLPFLVEFNTVNKTQTLFGVEKIYLRTHFLDSSYMRDWSAHRMLARFGLPHLRARKMRLFINGKRIGLYTVLEAADQEYVFARSFPNYSPASYALYKVKSLSIGCGRYEPEQLERAQLRLNESSIPPYVFERGDHRAPVTVRGPENHDACYADLVDSLFEEYLDVQLAYRRYNQDCGEMVVKEGLVDLDLGMKDDWDSSMIQFFNSHLGKFKCDDVSANLC